MSPISEEIDELWKRVGKEEGMRLLPGEDMSAFLSELGEESASIGRAKLEPWVSILEIGIEVYHELVQNHWSHNTMPALEERGEAT